MDVSFFNTVLNEIKPDVNMLRPLSRGLNAILFQPYGTFIILVIIVFSYANSLMFQEVHGPESLSETIAGADKFGFRGARRVKFLTCRACVKRPPSHGDDIARM